MEKTSHTKQSLVAEFLANIGVAWFVAGVIGTFVTGNQTLYDVILSIIWGLVFSVTFLFLGLFILRK